MRTSGNLVFYESAKMKGEAKGGQLNAIVLNAIVLNAIALPYQDGRVAVLLPKAQQLEEKCLLLG